MKKILFPTDYSETANNAFKYALQLADTREAELYVLHVYDPPLISGHISPVLVDNVIKKNQFLKLEQLHANSPVLKNMRTELNLDHVEVFFKVKEGLLIPEILNAIEELNIDFVVMGTDGEHDSLHRKILGTNTLSVISKVKVPILSVPKEAIFKKIETIMFTTLFSEEEESTLDQVILGAKKRNAIVKCVHVQQKGCKSCEEVYLKWKEKYKNDPISFYVFSDDNIEKSLISFVANNPIDLVAMVQRTRGYFETLFAKNIVQHLAKKLEVPLFVYKVSN